MSIAAQRNAIRHLLNEKEPADAMAAYYAVYHPERRLSLVTYPAKGERAAGYVALARTGLDLFRPVLTMRLPMAGQELDLEAGVSLLYQALQPGQPVIIHTMSNYLPLLRALFQIDSEQHLRLLKLERRRFEPIVNIFVTRVNSQDTATRFIVRNPPGDPRGEIVASAGINWQTPSFADVAVFTHAGYRRQGYGRSVVAAQVQHLLDQGITPLYTVAGNNQPSVELAEAVGFIDTLNRAIRCLLRMAIAARNDAVHQVGAAFERRLGAGQWSRQQERAKQHDLHAHLTSALAVYQPKETQKDMIKSAPPICILDSSVTGSLMKCSLVACYLVSCQ